MSGLGAIIVLLFFISQSHEQQPEPVGSISNQTEHEGNQTENGGQDIPPTLLVHSESTGEQIAVSDNVNIIVSKSTVSEGRRHGGGGGSDNGNPDEDFVLDAIVRVQPNPVPAPGTDVEVFGITNASSAVRSTFELFGPGCPLETASTPCKVLSDNLEHSPPSFNGPIPISLCRKNCEEYNVIFQGESFQSKGQYHVKATFYDARDRVVAIKGEDFRVLSFFVIPESPIGVILLIGTSVASLAGYAIYTRFRK